MQSQRPKILILGGTNFMGKALINTLTQNHPQYEVHTINRGRKYWGNQVYLENPAVINHYGDRRDSAQMTKMIGYINNKIGISQQNPWKGVVDFCSFRWRQIQSIAKSLKGKVQVYILISSDSLYNNSPFNGNPIREEEFSIQQAYRELKKKKKKDDKYGYDKLKCELYLQRTRHLPYISLRLPDVIGPYENTSRMWCTIQWVKRSDKYPLEINEQDIKKPLCFVFSQDVAVQICKLIKQSSNQNLVKNRSYNLCFDEFLTYKQFIEQIGKNLSPAVSPNFKQLKGDQQSNGMFPSTYTCISNHLAKSEINWSPTSFDDCLKKSIVFFCEKAREYQSEKKQMLRQFKRVIIDCD